MEESTKRFRKRDAILECIQNTTCHPTAETVHEMLRTTHPDISLATVYRNLALFKKQGKIISVGTVNGSERFDGNTQPHVHLVCEDCTAIEDLREMNIPDWLCQEAQRLTGYQVQGCQITFLGTCTNCQEK